MRSVGSLEPLAASPSAAVSLRMAVAARLSDYLELTKPRILLLVLVTVTVGYILGSAGEWAWWPWLHAVAGIGLVAAGTSAFNQLLERDTDARMERTRSRPLPAGRLLPIEAGVFGLAATLGGCVYLAVRVNLPTALLTAATFLLYTFLYTPLKRKTSLCTTIGAIPGALPPVLGWTAADGGLVTGAWLLFAILFLWQFPHFLAIAWLYREEYVRAGLRMVPPGRTGPSTAGWLAALYALALLPISLLPAQTGSALAGDGYFLTALVLGLGYLACAVRFLLSQSRQTARSLLWSSLIYLPLLLLSLTWDHLQLLS